MTDTAALRRLDFAHVWHPFTPAAAWREERAPVVVAADGFELIDADGRRYLDGVSSLWCNVHGHRVPEIDAAVEGTQLDRRSRTRRCWGWRASRRSCWRRNSSIARRGSEQGLLQRRRLDRGRGRAQDRLSIPSAEAGRPGAAGPLRPRRRRLSRRHPRGRRRRRASNCSMPSTATCCCRTFKCLARSPSAFPSGHRPRGAIWNGASTNSNGSIVKNSGPRHRGVRHGAACAGGGGNPRPSARATCGGSAS